MVWWAGALAWQLGPGDVSWAELALDYEAFICRVLAAFPHHKLQGTHFPPGERAHVLRRAAQLVQRRMGAVWLL